MKLMTPREVSEAFGISEHTLAKWRVAGAGPIYIRVGSCIRYRLSDLEEWLQSRERKPHAPTSETRKLALPILRGRKTVYRKHRLGRHRTQQDRRDESGSEGQGAGHDGPLARAKGFNEVVQ